MFPLLAAVASAATLTVGPSGTYTELSSALEDAEAGDLIRLEAGEYAVSERVDVPLIIEGAGADQTFLVHHETQDVLRATLHIEDVDGVVLKGFSLAGFSEQRALEIVGATVTVADVTFGAGSTLGQGPTVWMWNSDVSMLRTTFVEAGTVGQEGGFLYAVNSVLTVVDSTFSDGTARFRGGAVALRESDAWFVRTVFDGNTAEANGGAMDFQSKSGKHTLVVDGSTFRNNTAVLKNGNGGGLYGFGGTVVVKGSTFEGNSAFQGGALSFVSGDATVADSLLRSNSALDQGGAVAVYASELAMRRNRVYDNDAVGFGGAVMLGGSGSIEMLGNRVCRSTAGRVGDVAILGWSEPVEGSLRNNVFHATSSMEQIVSVWIESQGPFEASQNVFHATQSVEGAVGDTVVSALPGTDLRAANNVFVDHEPSAGLSGAVNDTHNLYWNGAWSKVGITQDPEFEDPALGCEHSFRPGATSPALDAGDPATFDDDGSRSDIGLYGGPDASLAWDVDGDGRVLGDCAPLDPESFGIEEEIVADGIDQDCDGYDLCYVDADLDGVGGTDRAPGTCTHPGLSSLDSDCDDTDAAVATDCEAPPTVTMLTAPPYWFCGHTGGTSWLWPLVVVGLAARREQERSRP